jgi:hypothetical protein
MKSRELCEWRRLRLPVLSLLRHCVPFLAYVNQTRAFVAKSLTLSTFVNRMTGRFEGSRGKHAGGRRGG